MDYLGGSGFPDFYSPEDDLSGGYLPAPGRPQAPKRLTQEELLALLAPKTADTPRPTPITGVQGLTGDDRRQAQQAGLWQGLAALGANMSGHTGEAAQQIGQIRNAQQGVVDQVNARQQQAYQDQQTKNAADIADEQQRAKVGALYGVYQKIAAAEPEGSPFVADAEAAAKLGDMSKLQDQLAQVPQRAAARQAGLDPDAWATNQRLQQQLKDELAHNSALSARPDKVADIEAVTPAEVEKTRQVGAITLANQKAEKLAPGWVAPPQYEPLSRVAAREEIVQGIKDKHEATRAQQGIRGQIRLGQDGTLGFVTAPDPVHPNGVWHAIEGQPVKKGSYTHFKDADSGLEYAMDNQRPELGAYVVPKHGPKETAPWAQPKPAPVTPSPAKALPPPPSSNPQADFQRHLEAAAAAKGFNLLAARQAHWTDAEIAAKLGVR
jgi:hypothetical protein